MLWNVLAIAAVTYLAICLFFWIAQRSFIYLPRSETPDHAAAVSLQLPDATLRISRRPQDGPQAVVYFGGNAEDVAFTVPELAAAFPDRAIYALHYRGYCGSSGRPTEAALRRDARAVFDMVHAEHQDIIVIGRSLGSSLAIQLAAERPVSRLVLIAPFKSILSIASRVAPFLPMRLLLKDTYESWRFASRVHCPTLIVAASDDELVPMADTKQLLAGFGPGIAQLRVIDGADHNSLSETTEFWDALVNGR
jgi:pimeloyl-ACP methyl ester carboxylesterase